MDVSFWEINASKPFCAWYGDVTKQGKAILPRRNTLMAEICPYVYVPLDPELKVDPCYQPSVDIPGRNTDYLYEPVFLFYIKACFKNSDYKLGILGKMLDVAISTVQYLADESLRQRLRDQMLTWRSCDAAIKHEWTTRHKRQQQELQAWTANLNLKIGSRLAVKH